MRANSVVCSEMWGICQNNVGCSFKVSPDLFAGSKAVISCLFLRYEEPRVTAPTVGGLG